MIYAHTKTSFFRATFLQHIVRTGDEQLRGRRSHVLWQHVRVHGVRVHGERRCPQTQHARLLFQRIHTVSRSSAKVGTPFRRNTG